MLPIQDNVPRRSPPLTVWLIIIANGLVFAFELMMPGEEALKQMFYLFGVVPRRYTDPRWATLVGFPAYGYWPFLTSMFLHGGWFHILSNMWFLWIFGDNVEDRMGHVRFLVFYLLCGVASGVFHLFTNPDLTVPAVGASGAIAGVAGAYFLLFPRARVVTMFPILFYPIFVQLPAVFFLGFWFFTQFLSGLLSLAGTEEAGGIAWWVHVGGFGAGMLIHRFFLKPRGRRREYHSDEYGIKTAWRTRWR